MSRRTKLRDVHSCQYRFTKGDKYCAELVDYTQFEEDGSISQYTSPAANLPTEYTDLVSVYCCQQNTLSFQ